jgi:hypothetical protein
MAENPEPKRARSRSRIDSLSVDRGAICKRISQFYQKDNEDRAHEVDARLQRYAKYRMWREGKDWPWENSSDSAIPDMMTASMRLQDTLHNSVMSQRPPIMAKAVQSRTDNQDREEKINHLIDWQFFEEQPGESIVGQLAEDFVNEGFFQAYTPWIEETRHVAEVKVHDPIPNELQPIDYFYELVLGVFPEPGAEIIPSNDGWDWKVILPEEKVGKPRKRGRVSFFTRPNGEVEMEVQREVVVFNGPRAIRKGWQDIGHPVRCENLQIKGPSNPEGASHVWMRDSPSIDEIQRLYDEGYYDLMTKEEAEKLGVLRKDENYQDAEEQKDVMQGKQEGSEPPKGAESHKTLTRLRMYDCYDINKDGRDEDVIWTYLVEPNILLRAKYLTQEFPMNPPRRPFAEAGLFTVNGRREAIGILEMMEGLHDLLKMSIDQGVDGGTIANAPFFFFRAASNMRPEVIRLWPGEGYPLSDPKNDVHFPQMGNQNQSFMFNMATMLNQMEERLTNIGDLQLGRVPQGKASALRTVSGMQTVLAQGDARPERVLRRFFMGLTQIWENFHALNELFMPDEKRFMLCGYIDPRKDPYAAVKRSEIKGKYRFTFSQNALNTSKEALQSALQDLMAAYVSPLAIQLGIIKPDGIYRLLRDYGRSKGPDPDKYLSPPTPGAMEPPINAEEAILQIMEGNMPAGSPMEGTQEHFNKLSQFSQSDEFGYLSPETVPLFRAYLQRVAEAMAQEQAAATLAAAAQQFGEGMQRPGVPGPAGAPQPGAQAMPPVNGGELMDEQLPGAGGGGNTAAV